MSSNVHIHIGEGAKDNSSPISDKPKSSATSELHKSQGNAHNAKASGVHTMPQTQLSPLEEAIFPHWMRANGIDPDTTKDHAYDYRGVYKSTNGKIHPPGTLKGVADRFNTLHSTRLEPIQELMSILHGNPQQTGRKPNGGQ